MSREYQLKRFETLLEGMRTKVRVMKRSGMKEEAARMEEAVKDAVRIATEASVSHDIEEMAGALRRLEEDKIADAEALSSAIDSLKSRPTMLAAAEKREAAAPPPPPIDDRQSAVATEKRELAVEGHRSRPAATEEEDSQDSEEAWKVKINKALRRR